MGEVLGGFFGIVLFLCAVVLGIVWIIVPFTLLGIRNRLDRMIGMMEKMERSLSDQTGPVKQQPGTSAPAKDDTSQTQIIEKSR